MSKGNPFFDSMTGKLGAQVFYRSGGEMRQRAYRGSGMVSNPRTRSQQEQRTQLANLVAFYRAAKPWFKKAFESKPVNYSDYNAFVSANLNKVSVYLSKEESANDTAVVAPYIVSRGSLQPVEVTAGNNNVYTTNISVGDLEITEETTVGQLSQAILNNNSQIQNGDQLSFLSLVQMTNSETGYPYISARLYEMTIDVSSPLVARNQLPEFCLTITNGYIGTGQTIAAGGFAYALSRKDQTGKLLVSTQRVILTDGNLYDNYQGATVITRAVSSYGSGDDVFLNPDTEGGLNAGEGGGQAVQATINEARLNSLVLTNGSSARALATGDTITLTGNGLEGATVTLLVGPQSSEANSFSDLSVTITSQTSLTGTVATSANELYLYGIQVNGVTLMTFASDSGGELG